MSDILSVGTQKLETICSKKLNSFVSKLNQHSNILRKHSTELNNIAGDVMTKSQQLIKIENIKPEELKCYTLDQRDRVLSEILCQANAQIITAARSIKEIEDFHTELKDEYQNLSSSVNVLRILATDGTIITGDCKQKSISYYLEEACRILYTWKLYQKSLDISLNRIDMRNSESIIQFKSVTMMPQNLSSNLDRYLLYSIFLYSQK